jgi:hypothetical protein
MRRTREATTSTWLANDPASQTSASFDAWASKVETRVGDFRLQGTSGFLCLTDADGEKPALGDEQAKGTVLFVATPFRRAVDGPSLFGELPLAQGRNDLAERGLLDGQALRKRKERSVRAMRRRAQNHKLAVAKLGGWGWDFRHDCLHRDAPARYQRFHRPVPGARARRGR